MKFLAVIFFSFLTAATIQATVVRYELPCLKSITIVSYQILMEQIGVRELTGHNDGIMIEKYLASAGLNPKGRYPYCASGQVYCYRASAYKLGLDYSNVPVPRTGLARGIWFHAIKKGSFTKPLPQINDLIIWGDPASLSGHIERIVAVKPGGWVKTVGFNTNCGTGGTDWEGGGVCYKVRNVYQHLGRNKLLGFVGFKNI